MPRLDMPVNTNDQSFDRVLNSGLPVALILSDGAKLDAPLEEALHQVAHSQTGHVIVARLNVHENPQTAARFDGALPGLITFRDGEEVAQAHSLTPHSFREHIRSLLGRGPRPAGETASAQPPQPQMHTAARPVPVTDVTFQREVLDSDLPVLVDLWAAWCGPCRMIAPLVEKFAKDYSGRMKVAKLNVDENPQTPGRYQVQGIPTLLVFRGGKVVDRIVGFAPEPVLRGRLDAVLRP